MIEVSVVLRGGLGEPGRSLGKHQFLYPPREGEVFSILDPDDDTEFYQVTIDQVVHNAVPNPEPEFAMPISVTLLVRQK